MSRQPKKNNDFIESFSYALEGIKTAFIDERNLRSHFLVGIIVLIVSLILPLTKNEWLWILLVIFLVIITELINTLVENVVDLITLEYHPLAKKIKDVAAGIVLITAIFSVIIGLVIFLPKILIILK